jgi:hypothetical protein
MKKIIVANLVIITIISSCSSSGDSGKLHPNSLNLGYNNIELIKVNENTVDNSDINQYINNIIVDIYDTNHKKIDMVFGRISSAEFGENNVFILENIKQEILNINLLESDSEVISKRGAGPGDIERASRLKIYKDEWLLVNNGYRIEIYTLNDGKVTHYKSVMFDNIISDFCISNDQIVVHIRYNLTAEYRENYSSVSGQLQIYSLPDFEDISKFGKPYVSDNPMLIETMSEGKVYCSDESDSVIFTYERMPKIVGHSLSTGEVLWEAIIQDMNYVTALEVFAANGMPGLRYETPETNMIDRFASVAHVYDNFFLIQIDRRQIRGRDHYADEDAVITYIINASTGEFIYLGRDYDRIIHYLDGARMITIQRDFIDVFIKTDDKNHIIGQN